jgi:DNA-binding PadR family transcriptional regulator
MIVLQVVYPDGEEKVFRFDQDEVVIGRRPENDLMLPATSVSSRHARLYREGDQVWIEDLRSTNGTGLNGRELVGAAPITPFDEIIIDNFQLSIRPPEGSSAGQFSDIELPPAAWFDVDDGQGGDGLETPTAAGAALLSPVRLEEDRLAGDLLVDPQAEWPDAGAAPSSFEPALAPQTLEPAPATQAVPPGRTALPSADPTAFPSPSPDPSAVSLLAPGPAAAPFPSPGPAAAPFPSPGPAVAPLPPPGPIASPGSPAALEPPAPLAGAPRPGAPGAAAPAPPEPAPYRPAGPVALPSFHPRVPQSIEETGLKRGILTDLILKAIYYAGELTGYELVDELKLPFNQVLEPLLQELRRDKCLEVKGGGGNFGLINMTFSVTTRGGELVHQILERNRYVGPAPVSMDAYIAIVKVQSLRGHKITRRRLVPAFAHLSLEDDIFDGIGPAMNSGMAMLLYGPPGNGKSAIGQTMVNCFDDVIFVPYAIEVDGNIIKVFDEHNHHPVAITGSDHKIDFDHRFVLCRRPMIMVGGELTLEMLDMRYSSEARFYEAPFQMKANGGILLIDDLGRQKVSPKELLNRWIVPLENEVDIISLVTGKKLKVPFDVWVVFATNLDPADLVDDAFLRRVRYKLEVRRPSPARFRDIFVRTCASRRVPWSEEGYSFLMELYRRDGRPINAGEPRNLLEAIQSLADYFECVPELRPELIERAYQGYFARPMQGG